MNDLEGFLLMNTLFQQVSSSTIYNKSEIHKVCVLNQKCNRRYILKEDIALVFQLHLLRNLKFGILIILLYVVSRGSRR